VEGARMKLKRYVWSLYIFAIIITFWRWKWNITDDSTGIFSLALVFIAAGLQLVDREIEELRQTMSAKVNSSLNSESQAKSPNTAI
jgi:hypothetical protein